MKKNIIFINFLLIFFLFISCTVNDWTGLIRVENHTNTELKNVKVGDTIVAYSVLPGNYVDYWYSYEIIGKISSEGVEVNNIQDDIKFKLKPGYWVFITAQKYDHDDQVEISVRKQGSEQDEDWHEED